MQLRYHPHHKKKQRRRLQQKLKGNRCNHTTYKKAADVSKNLRAERTTVSQKSITYKTYPSMPIDVLTLIVANNNLDK